MKISIHALLAEGDRTDGHIVGPVKFISIHALLAEGDFAEPMITR